MAIDDFLALEGKDLDYVLWNLSDEERAAVAMMLEDEDLSPYIKYGGNLKRIITEEWGEGIWSKQEEILDSFQNHRRTCVVTSPGVGKDLPLDTPIPTPSGWTLMGDIVVGDLILDQSGLPTRVTHVTETQYNNLYRVTFNDGTSLVAGEDHQWSTLDADTRRRLERRMRALGRPIDWREHWESAEVRTTREIAETVWSEKHARNNHLVPTASPLELPEVDLPLDPYVFGAWLGDGDSCRPYMTIGDAGMEIADGFAVAGLPLKTLNGYMQFSFPGENHGDTHRLLRSMGVLKNKHIPDLYLRASYKQRLALLRGLMDTDGFVRANGAGADFGSEVLANGVAELVRSLGSKVNVRIDRATISGRDVGLRYRLAFASDFNPFGHIGYKRDGWNPEGKRRPINTGRIVVKVEPVDTIPTRCISVDNAEHLYLAGRDFIPTHNSDIVSTLICAAVASSLHDPGRVRIVTTAHNFRLVKTIMWPYIKRSAAYHKLPGYDSKFKASRIGTVEWHVNNILVADGVASGDQDETAMRGIHALGRVIVIVDEAGGISHTIGRVLNGLLTGEDDRLVVLGNPPTDETDTWFEWFSQQGIVNTIHIPYTETPNFTDEVTPICKRCGPREPEHRIAKHLTSQASIDDVRSQYPDDNDPYVRAFLYAEFPTGSIAKAIPMQFLQNAMPVKTHPNGNPEDGVPRVDDEWLERSQRDGLIRLGIDVAADGGDEFVIAQRRGWHGSILHTQSGAANEDAELVAGAAKRFILEADQYHKDHEYTEPVIVNIDRNGVGWGVESSLRNWVVKEKLNVVVVGVMVSEKARKDQKFKRQRDEIWWNFRELLADPAVDITLADDRNLTNRSLIKQLNGPTYTTGSDGRIVIEAKATMKSRTGGTTGTSPDRADALLLAFYDSPTRRRNIVPTIFPELRKSNEHAASNYSAP